MVSVRVSPQPTQVYVRTPEDVQSAGLVTTPPSHVWVWPGSSGPGGSGMALS